jgi:capsular polysaccharide biosynthesis protein
MYSASTTLYVGKNTDAVGVQTADLNLGSNLILDYREIAKSRRVAYVVIDELGLKTSARAMSNRISVNQRDMTRVIEISVSDVNPQMAMDITNKVAEVFQSKVKEIMQIENVQIIDKAEMPMYPVSPNKQMNYLLGIIIGLVIGVGIVFLIAFFDDTIKTPDDVQRHVELSVIGAIPAFQKIGRRA